MNQIKLFSILFLKSLPDGFMYFDALARAPEALGIESASAQEMQHAWDVPVFIVSVVLSFSIFFATTGLYLRSSRGGYIEHNSSQYFSIDESQDGRDTLKTCLFKGMLVSAGFAKSISKSLSLSTYMAALTHEEGWMGQLGLFALFFFPVATGEAAVFLRQTSSDDTGSLPAWLSHGVAWIHALSCAMLYWRSANDFPQRLELISCDLLQDNRAAVYVFFNTLLAFCFLFKQKDLSLDSLDASLSDLSSHPCYFCDYSAPFYKGLVSTSSLIAFLYTISEGKGISHEPLVVGLMVLMAAIFLPKIAIEHSLFSQLSPVQARQANDGSIQGQGPRV